MSRTLSSLTHVPAPTHDLSRSAFDYYVMLSFLAFVRNMVAVSAVIGVVMLVPAYYLAGDVVSTSEGLQRAGLSLRPGTAINSSSALLRLTIGNLEGEKLWVTIPASYIINATAHALLWWNWRSVGPIILRQYRS